MSRKLSTPLASHLSPSTFAERADVNFAEFNGVLEDMDVVESLAEAENDVAIADLPTLRECGLLGSNSAGNAIAYFGGANSYRNKIINGKFEVAQRGNSVSGTSGFYGLDQWRTFLGDGDTHTQSQESFTLGQTDVPGNPRYYLRCDFNDPPSTVVALLEQRIEGADTLAGKQATLTFWYRANGSASSTSPTNYITQDFGTGGSPSSNVTTGLPDITLTYDNTWRKYTGALTLPSVSGKTFGTNGDDYLRVVLFQATEGTTGMTVDVANVSLVEGDATQEEDPGEWRPVSIEETLCYRYYYRTGQGAIGDSQIPATDSVESHLGQVVFPVTMRATPTATVVTTPTYTSCSTIGDITTNRMSVLTVTSTTSGGNFRARDGIYEFEAEL